MGGRNNKKNRSIMYHLQLNIKRTLAVIEPLSFEQKGLLFERIMNYANGSDEPTGDLKVEQMFGIIKIDIDANKAKYLSKQTTK